MSKKKPLKAVKVLNPYPSERRRKPVKSVIDVGRIRRELEKRLKQLVKEFPRFADLLNRAITECGYPELSNVVKGAIFDYLKSKYMQTDEDWERRCEEMKSKGKGRGRGRKKPSKRKKPKPPQDEDRA